MLSRHLSGVRAASLPPPGSQKAAAALDITSEIKTKGGRGGQSPSEDICPQQSLARAVCVTTLGYKKAWCKEEDLTFPASR